MQSDTSQILVLLSWLWENAATAIWGTISVWAVSYLLRRGRDIAQRIAEALPALFLAIKQTSPPKWLRGIYKVSKLKNRRWMRRYRFDTLWISREVSRGHTCQIIFLLWFGLWLLAFGMRESFLLNDTPLSGAPGLAIVSALPMYIFEIAWLCYSGRADELIKYRQRVQIWRWWH